MVLYYSTLARNLVVSFVILNNSFPLTVNFFTAEAKKNKCSGDYSTKGSVVNLCDSHFPDASSDKIWFIKFYAPWCGHCQQLKPAWEQLGKAFKNDDSVKIGAIDCDQQQNKGICGKYGVQGFPTLKSIVNGKPKAYNNAREFEPLRQYIEGIKSKKGSKGGSSKCQKGLFKSNIKDSVTPLCNKHYPDNKSKNSWVIAFYNKDDFDKKDGFNKLALNFGNEPPEKNKQTKRVEKQSVRVEEAIDFYSIKGKPTKKAGKSKDILAKFGAICCDCVKGETDPKCEGLTLPHVRVYDAKSKKDLDYSISMKDEGFSIEKFAGFALEKLGFATLDKEDSSSKEEL